MTTLVSNGLTEFRPFLCPLEQSQRFVTVKCRKHDIPTMRAKTLVALLVTALMLTPVQAGDVSAYIPTNVISTESRKCIPIRIP